VRQQRDALRLTRQIAPGAQIQAPDITTSAAIKQKDKALPTHVEVVSPGASLVWDDPRDLRRRGAANNTNPPTTATISGAMAMLMTFSLDSSRSIVRSAALEFAHSLRARGLLGGERFTSCSCWGQHDDA